MRRKIAITVVLAALAFAALAGPAPPLSAPIGAPLGAVEVAEAAPASKSLGGGGGDIAGAGDRFGGLLSGWGVPILISVAGFLLIGSLFSRNAGASVGIVLITVVGLIFLLSPGSIETAAKGIAGTVFR